MSEELKGTAAEGKASLSDLVALAGARAVSVCGGPVIPMTLGRVDATAASGDPTDRMPGETFNIEQLKASFLSKGLSVKEMVILSGGCRIHCRRTSRRIRCFGGLFWETETADVAMHPIFRFKNEQSHNHCQSILMLRVSSFLLPDPAPEREPCVDVWVHEKGRRLYALCLGISQTSSTKNVPHIPKLPCRDTTSTRTSTTRFSPPFAHREDIPHTMLDILTQVPSLRKREDCSSISV